MRRRGQLKIVAIDGDLVSAEEAPAVEPATPTAANDAAPNAPGWGPLPDECGGGGASATPAAPRWRSLAALALSLAVHAALVAAIAEGDRDRAEELATEQIHAAVRVIQRSLEPKLSPSQSLGLGFAGEGARP
ncbi:MAG: hypothetical protein F9K19_12430 [Rhizobiaceae bacterium]|nr:MAG: hypothetical protein F9K19_12430 [Rhizobiaceae bacterium]